MFARVSARVPLAALLAAGTLVGCATAQPTVSPTTEPQAQSTPDPATPEPTIEATASPSPSPSEAAERAFDVSVPTALSLTVPGDWEEEDIASSTTFNFRIGVDRWVVFTAAGPDTVQGWLDQIASDESFVASEPAPVELDGASGFTVDFVLAEGEEEAALFEEASWGFWAVTPERPNRAWVLDAPDGTLLIVTDAPERAFDNWVAVVDAALATLQWREG